MRRNDVPRKKAGQADGTTRDGLAAAIKTARDVMRKDAGLNGDLDRIPQLAWLLFLKAFDDLERRREVTERQFRAAIEPPYRWRDWAVDPAKGGRTGDALLEFVNGDLLPQLRDLKGSGERDPRDVLASVFKETFNRMLSGYLLRDVVNVVNRVDFTSSDDIHTMAHLYESMLREMRDAAGDSGEFYTPRPVIRFIVQQVDPQLGEVVLDPAAGTEGFLAEALEHMRPQVQTVQQWRELQTNIRGIEKKPLPYLLATMNLLLHEVEQPNLRRENALATPLSQIGASARVGVIVTNPPFGGEEEEGVQKNFPQPTQTSETALLFLQTIQRLLKPAGRCGMIVPNGVLFNDGPAARRIKQRLLEECNLHTIVRLPPGVFAPYTAIPTNLLFFDKTGPTKEIWFYQQPLPEGRKNYTKTRPLAFEEFAECQHWWGGRARLGRAETEQAWRLSIADIEADSFNLDRKNPNRADDLSHLPPQQLVADLLDKQQQIQSLLTEIQRVLAKAGD
jgi:type I restriction enzyme M protein